MKKLLGWTAATIAISLIAITAFITVIYGPAGLAAIAKATIFFAASNLVEETKPRPTPAPLIDPRQQELELQALLNRKLQPFQRHHKIKAILLDQLNQARQSYSLPTLRMGTNPAAQLHAEDTAAHCYSAHWDKWGLKPNHRYTLTGGAGADQEIIHAPRYCESQSQTSEANPEEKAKEITQAWLQTPEYQAFLLDPAHTTINIGFSTEEPGNLALVHHFTSDYVQYTVRPSIDQSGVFRLEATLSGATFSPKATLPLEIDYEPPPRPLTKGQLHSTFSLCPPKAAALIHHPNEETDNAIIEIEQSFHCLDPQGVPADTPAALTKDQSDQQLDVARRMSEVKRTRIYPVLEIPAQELSLTNNYIRVSGDLNHLLTTHGPGIYTITLKGKPDQGSTPTAISRQAMFWRYNPPHDASTVQWALANKTFPIAYQEFTKRDVDAAPQTARQPRREPLQAGSQPPPTPAPSPTPPSQLLIRTPTPAPTTEAANQPEATPTQVALNPNRPTVAPTRPPVPTPTPTPTPPILPPKVAYQHDSHSFSITAPESWRLTERQANGFTLTTPDGQAFIKAFSEILPEKGHSFNEYLEKRRTELLRLAATDGHTFREHSVAQVRQHNRVDWQLHYRHKAPGDPCTYDVTEIITRSTLFPREPYGYIVRAFVCETSMATHDQQRQEIISSFREWAGR